MTTPLPPDADHASLREYLQRLEDNIQAVQHRLRRFEQEFGMDSEEFYSRLQNAELEERIEYAEWAGEHDLLRRLLAQRDDLLRRLPAPDAAARRRGRRAPKE